MASDVHRIKIFESAGHENFWNTCKCRPIGNEDTREDTL